MVNIESSVRGGRIYLYPAKGKYRPVVSITHSDHGDGLLLIDAKEGQELVYLGGDRNRSGAVIVRNDIGDVVGKLVSNDLGHGMVSVCHRSENLCKSFEFATE